MNPTLLNRLIIVFSFLGLFIAGTLSISQHTGSALSCGVAQECDKVAEYVATQWHHFPVADLGVGAFGLLALFSLSRIFMGLGQTAKFGAALSGVAVIAHIALTVFSITVIKATCLWCIGAMLTMSVLLVLHLLLLRANNPDEKSTFPAQDGVLAVVAAMIVLMGLSKTSHPAINEPAGLKEKTIAYFETSRQNRLGTPSAPIHVVEFFDLMCPHCKKTYFAAKKIMNDNPGKLCWEFRHFPINAGGIPFSRQAALFAEICADEGKFFPYLDAVFSVEAKDLNVDALEGMAVGLGVSRQKIDARVVDPKDPAMTRVTTDMALADQFGFQMAPVLFIGKLDEKNVSANTSKQAFDKLRELGLTVDVDQIEAAH